MRKSWKIRKQSYFKLVTTMLLGIIIMTGLSTKSYAAPKQMSDGNVFDAEFYATTYPDVVAVLGIDEAKLYNHFVTCGSLEGRLPHAPGAIVPVTETTQMPISNIKIMPDGNKFDPIFYATTYPDVAAILGTDETVLYNHYLLCGINEGRIPYDANAEQAHKGQPMTSQIATSVKPSDFKFLGYSINENHYQEWKTALGYTGNDTVGEVIKDINLGTHIYCKSNEFNTRIALGEPYNNNNVIASYHWITSNEFVFEGGHNSSFSISFNYKRLPIYDGPIVSGMTFDEVKKIVGYNDALSVENGTYRMCTLNDGTNVLIDAIYHNEIIVYRPESEIHLWFFKDIIENISISFAL